MAAKYSAEFKQKAVDFALTSDLSRTKAAQELGIAASTLRRWIKDQAEATTPIAHETATPPSTKRKTSPTSRRSPAKPGLAGVSEAEATPAPADIADSAPVSPPASAPKKVSEKTETPIPSSDVETRHPASDAKQSPQAAPRMTYIKRPQIISHASVDHMSKNQSYLPAYLKYAASFLILLFGLTAFQLRNPAVETAFLWPATQASLQADIDGALNDRDAGDPNPHLQKLAQYAPLSPKPYEVSFSLSYLEDDDVTSGQTEALAAAALMRDPRNVVARLVLAEYFMNNARWEEALDEITVVFDLWPDTRTDIVAALRRFLTDSPEGSSAIMERLKTRPAWGDYLVVDLPLEVLNLREAREALVHYPIMQGRFVEQLARERGYQSAYLAWVFLGRGQEDFKIEFPIDSEFNGSESPRPFNWKFMPQNAEIDRKGGLYISYMGRKVVRLAQQIIVLTSGSYTLSTDWSGEFVQSAGDLVWTVRCIATGETLAEISLFKSLADRRHLSVDFETSGGDCTFLELGFWGDPGEYPQPIRATIDYVTIAERQLVEEEVE